MNWLSRVNPAKHLFLKVFLYFWLAALVIFLSSLWLAKQLNSEVKYLPLNPAQQQDLDSITDKIQFQIDKNPEQVNVKRLIRLASKRHRFGLLLIDAQSREIWHQLPRQRPLPKELFTDFEPQSSPLSIDIQGLAFIGPSLVKSTQSDYMLFIVAPKPRGGLGMFRQQYPGLFILFICGISGILCYLFARGVLKPIMQLRNASQKMAAGEMGVRVGSASLRLDEIGQLGRDFNHMSKQVEGLLNNQKRLLADISHELRSPLARLQLSIGIALQQHEETLSKETENALQRIEKEAFQIEKMIAQVLLLSRLDNQQPIQNTQQISLEKVMQPIISDAQFEAKQKDKTLSYQAGPNINLQADSQILSSAIENVIRNAIYYSHKQIKVAVFVEDGQAVLVVEDDGDGIDESQLNRIFEAFYRESSARDRNSGGVGLGLAIAHHAIVKHQGNIQVSNKPTGGLVVKICIPL